MFPVFFLHNTIGKGFLNLLKAQKFPKNFQKSKLKLKTKQQNVH